MDQQLEVKVDYLLTWIFLGIAGLLIEVFFTGISSLLRRDWAATSRTYLWMHPIYASGGFAVKIIHDNVILFANPFIDAIVLAILVYVPIFYGMEVLSGLASQKILGRVLWDYGHSKWSPMGLINLRYAPYWLLLALFMHPVILYLGKFIDIILYRML